MVCQQHPYMSDSDYSVLLSVDILCKYDCMLQGRCYICITLMLDFLAYPIYGWNAMAVRLLYWSATTVKFHSVTIIQLLNVQVYVYTSVRTFFIEGSIA